MAAAAANPGTGTMQDVVSPSTTHSTTAITPATAAASAECSIPPSSLLIEAVDERSVRGSGDDGRMQDLDDMSDDGDGGYGGDDYEGDSDKEGGHTDVQYCQTFSIC